VEAQRFLLGFFAFFVSPNAVFNALNKRGFLHSPSFILNDAGDFAYECVDLVVDHSKHLVGMLFGVFSGPLTRSTHCFRSAEGAVRLVHRVLGVRRRLRRRPLVIDTLARSWLRE
jgi:membrane associated rhomboid family serine protease